MNVHELNTEQAKNIVYFKNGEYETDVLQTISNHKSLIKIHHCAVDWAATRVKNE